MLFNKFDLSAKGKLYLAMSQVERKIVYSVDAHEREFGRALPDNSFYKLLAIRICQRLSVGG